MRGIGGIVVVLLPALAGAETLEGKVVAVQDGDTVTLLDASNRQVRVRLAEIDTPEKRQPYGKRARQALSAIVFGRQVKVEVATTDRYGRSVGRIHVDGIDVNRRMIAEGHAWVYRKYCRDRGLIDVEGEARIARRGLWALPQAQRTPPWEWRARDKRDRRRARDPSEPDHPSQSRCGTKRRCGEMTGCAEARFYLTTCQVHTLDADGDGVPCEKLCRHSATPPQVASGSATQPSSQPAGPPHPIPEESPADSVQEACQLISGCREMTDCREARYWYRLCGLRSLDRDGDGVPCEELCR